MNFGENSVFIDIQQIRSILKHVPDIVFCNDKMTKMHDSLPLSLFSLHNFLILFDKKLFVAAAYWFPIAISMMAFDMKSIGYEMRHLCFEVALWFLVYYKKALDEYDGRKLPERKYKENKDVLAYSNNLLIELTNSLFTKIDLINKYENIKLSRDSTTPLEHTFGSARIRANDIHTLKKFLSVVGIMNRKIYKQNSEDIEKIKGRSASFGVTVESKSEREFIFSSSPQQIAMEFLSLININIFSTNSEYNNLYSFIDYLRDFDEEKSQRR